MHFTNNQEWTFLFKVCLLGCLYRSSYHQIKQFWAILRSFLMKVKFAYYHMCILFVGFCFRCIEHYGFQRLADASVMPQIMLLLYLNLLQFAWYWREKHRIGQTSAKMLDLSLFSVSLDCFTISPTLFIQPLFAKNLILKHTFECGLNERTQLT